MNFFGRNNRVLTKLHVRSQCVGQSVIVRHVLKFVIYTNQSLFFISDFLEEQRGAELSDKIGEAIIKNTLFSIRA
jgi:hypothetical protein